MPNANLLENLPESPGSTEVVEVLARASGARVERIVSRGQGSPPGWWYDQGEEEWVAVLSGEAGLELEGEERIRVLRPGDWVHLEAHRRHRVAWTSAAGPTVWLAVFFAPPAPRPPAGVV